jgi:hypothetical protein
MSHKESSLTVRVEGLAALVVVVVFVLVIVLRVF